MAKHLFFSYKSEDYQEIIEYKRIFEERGIKVWMAPESIIPGSSYGENIGQSIKDSYALILFLSKKSEKSKWIIRELTCADDDNIDIYALYLEDFKIENYDILLRINNNQTRNLFENKNSILNELIDTIINKYKLNNKEIEIKENPIKYHIENSNNYQDKIDNINRFLKYFNTNCYVDRFIESIRFVTFYLKAEDNKKINIQNIKKNIDDLKLLLFVESVFFNKDNLSIQININNQGFLEFDKINLRYKVTLGIDELNQLYELDLRDMSHILIGGTSGTGKTLFLNQLLASLIIKNNHKMLKIGIIDLSCVSYNNFKNLNHLMCPIANDINQAEILIHNTLEIVYKRFEILNNYNCMNIDEYNKKMLSLEKFNEMFTRIIIIIDPIDDLLNDSKKINNDLTKLVQISRAAGVNIILSAIYSNAQYIPSLIKCNMSTRIAFKLPSVNESMAIIDEPGAEKLLNRGDMLVKFFNTKRVQCPYISPNEIKYYFNNLAVGEQDFLFDYDELDNNKI